MADILIRGMEMPTRCGLCPMFCDDFNDYCSAAQRSIPFDAEKPEWCPLVPLPDGHGRLGDLHALLEQIRDGFEKAEKWMDYVEDDPELRPRAEATVVAFWECGAKVKMAPTIIPAEGETDNA